MQIQSTLRNFVLAPVVMAAAAFTSTAAMASTIQVPFSFTVAGKVCPAGQYSIQKNSSSNLVTVRSKDASRGFTVAVTPGSPAPTDARVVMRFDSVGPNHALQSVQVGPLVSSRLDKKSKVTGYSPTQIVTGQ